MLGWLADVYFSRYKFVLISFIVTIVLTVISSVLFMYDGHSCSNRLAKGVIICLAGIGLFESTAIQFSMDQMIEASSDQLSTFIHWYNWSCSIGQVIRLYISVGVLEDYSSCTIKLNYTSHQNFYDSIHPHHFTTASTAVFIVTSLQFVCACVGLCLLVYYKNT